MSNKLSNIDTLIKNAYESQGATADVNKVYLEFIKSELYIPAELNENDSEEPFKPLFSIADEYVFMVAFDDYDRLIKWAGENAVETDYVCIKGRDLISGIGENVFLALNPSFEFYKEFSPEEIQRIKTIVSRIDSLANPSAQ